ILEAEAANIRGGRVESGQAGFSGTGYVKGAEAISWMLDIPKTGLYLLQYRYARNGGDNIELPLRLDGKDLGQLSFWYTGNEANWTVDQQLIRLSEGRHQLELGHLGTVWLDQLGWQPFALPE
ncbi:MAG: carbohydrate-binding protein, partial [Sinomicrobium sp.]|nr:carbohydrate-binding protein [Sinomicrobium sp.]